MHNLHDFHPNIQSKMTNYTYKYADLIKLMLNIPH